MKKKLLRCSIFILLCCLTLPGFCQTLASSVEMERGSGSKEQKGAESLKNVLTLLEERYKVTFFYKTGLVEGLLIDNSSKKLISNNLENDLRNLLKKHNLVFKKAGESFYVIVPKEADETGAFKKIDNPALSPRAMTTEFTALSQPSLNLLSKLGSASLNVFAVTGKVVDETGTALPGVNVLVKGTTGGTTTGADGSYSLTAPDGNSTLVFSFIGYTTQEVAINNRAVVDVSLAPDVQALSEVVVVGYGTQDKRTLTNSVVTLTSKDLLQGAFNSPLQMIDGKVAGVSISNVAAADPNRATEIQVRGASSLNAGNGPLIIIDGMPGGDLRNVAQQDIESITILKDGGAAAIYGSRGANGVVLVTTKKGSSGKVSVTYDSFIDYDMVSNRPDILSPERFLAEGRDQDFGARTDWYDQLIREDNFGQNHFLAVGGGSENTVFRISGNYRTKSGIDIASDRKEYGLRANFQQRALNGLLEFGGNISYRIANEEYTNYSAFQQAVKLNPTIPVMDPNNPSRYNFLQGFNTFNPIQNLKTRENGADRIYSIFDFNIRLNPLKNLSSELKLARQGNDRLAREYHTSQAAESIENKRRGRARLENERWTDWTLEWINNYSLMLDRHDFRILGGYSYQEFNNSSFWAENANFPTDAYGYNNLDEGDWNREKGRLGLDSRRSKEKVIAFIGRINYDFDDTYLFSASMRYEGNTKFGADNKWGLFPAASAAWRLAKLPLIENINAINDLKLRASYGVTGRSGFPRYLALAKYQGFGQYQNDEGQWIRVYGPENNPNLDLRWEKQVSYNLGLDFALFKNKVSGSFDAFIRQGKDVIADYDVPVPPFLHDKLWTNVASTSSRGVELNVSWNVVEAEDFSYTTNVVGSYIRSRLDKFSNGTYTKGFMERYGLPSPGNPGNAQRLEDGTEIGSFYGFRYAGVDESGNILIWENAVEGGNRILASQGANDDKTYIGHGAPRYDLTWGNTLRYKGFDLALYFRGRFDYQILNLYQMYYGLTAEPGVNLLEDAYGRNAQIKSNKVITDYFLESGDFFRLDNLTLGWSPKFSNSVFSNVRVYGTVRNVFTLTKYTGLDPTSVNIAGLEPGIGDLNVYPVTRNFALGAQITF